MVVVKNAVLFALQNDYAFSSRNSALLWHDTKQMPKVAATGHSKGKYCSIALAAATFFVLIAVLSIAGLALYMGALRSEPSSRKFCILNIL